MSTKKTGITGATAPMPGADGKWWHERDLAGKRWINIGVVTYHNNLNAMLPSEIRATLMWQHYPTGVAFQDALGRSGVSNEFVTKIISEAWADATDGYEGVVFRENAAELGMDAYVVSGPPDTVKKYVLQALDAVVEDAAAVGGDDSYFDYYPDAVYVMLQLCIALGLKDEFAVAREAIILRRYEDDPDEIPTWEETAP